MTSIEGLLNFRDVGGVSAGPGLRVARGRLFRSDTPQFLTDDDIDVLVGQLGLRSVIDLRLGYELKIEGRGLLEGTAVAHHHLPVTVHDSMQVGTATPILQADDPVVPHYLGYLTSAPESIAGAFRVLAQDGALPAVVHCAAGKDRTGVVVAMVLSAIGVPDDEVAHEYSLSQPNIAAVLDRLRGMESYGPAIDTLPPEANLTPPHYMQRFLEAIGEIYGGARGYLMANGVTDDEIAIVRSRLVEPDVTPGSP